MTEIPAPYGNTSSSADTTLARIFEAAECSTQAELAKLLSIKQSSISGAIRRNSIPTDWLVKLFCLKRINPEWVITGQGPKHLAPAANSEAPSHVVHLTKTRPPKDCSTQELINELVRRALRDM